MRLLLCTMVRVLHRPTLIGRENAPVEGACFIIANHSGMYDGVLMNCLIKGRPFAAIMTDEFLCGPGLMPFFFRKRWTKTVEGVLSCQLSQQNYLFWGAIRSNSCLTGGREVNLTKEMQQPVEMSFVKPYSDCKIYFSGRLGLCSTLN